MDLHTTNETNFSFTYYEHMLRQIQKHGYKISSFETFDPDQTKSVIVRHDVDYTLHGVQNFAQIEHSLGIKATYLFRVHADEYNLFSCGTYKILEDLIDKGHEIGLHFEAMNVGRALGINPEKLLIKEKQILETVIGRKVKTCSEHRDYSNVIHSTPKYETMYDPYEAGFQFFASDAKFTKEMKYLSDSNATWREGDPLVHLGKHDRFQFLIHPDWWFETDMLTKGRYYHSIRAEQ